MFALALTVQLEPYNLRVRLRHWPPHVSQAALQATAYRLGKRYHCRAAIWYELNGPSARTRLHALNLERRTHRVRDLGRVEPSPFLARILAVATRTLLRAELLERNRSTLMASSTIGDAHSDERPLLTATFSDQPASANNPKVSDKTVQNPTTRVHQENTKAKKDTAQIAVTNPRQGQARLALHAGYTVLAYPIGGEWRHGPATGLQYRFLPAWYASFWLRLGIPRQERTPTASWTQTHGSLAVDVLYRTALPFGVGLVAGPQLQVSLTRLSAEELPSGREQRATLWEVAVGGEAGLTLRISATFSVYSVLSGLWLPLRSRVQISDSVLEPGAFELGVDSGLRVEFL